MNKFVVFAVCVAAVWAAEADWEPLTTILNSAVADRVFPGAVAAVFDEKNIYYKKAVGGLTYGVPPPATPNTVPEMNYNTMFDLASCSKVVGGTTAMALLYQMGGYKLDDKVSKYLPGFEANGKGEMTIENILTHNSGLKADPWPNYASKEFGCPEMLKDSPQLAFSCRNSCYKSLLNETLSHKIGETYVYSDLNFMAVMNVAGVVAKQLGVITEAEIPADCPVGDVGEAQCYYQAFFNKYVVKALGLKRTMFNPPKDLWNNVAPTENYTTFPKRQLQGEVHDPNTFAMGGVSGHAGVFSDVEDLITFTRGWLFAPETASGFLNAATKNLFIKARDASFSSRALGWNTNNYTISDRGWNQSCGTLSEKTFMHIGYTGTMICADPERGLGVIVLGMRVYPDDSNSSANKQVRTDFSTMAQKIYDSLQK